MFPTEEQLLEGLGGRDRTGPEGCSETARQAGARGHPGLER